jgi:hypothetical protein
MSLVVLIIGLIDVQPIIYIWTKIIANTAMEWK